MHLLSYNSQLRIYALTTGAHADMGTLGAPSLNFWAWRLPYEPYAGQGRVIISH